MHGATIRFTGTNVSRKLTPLPLVTFSKSKIHPITGHEVSEGSNVIAVLFLQPVR